MKKMLLGHMAAEETLLDPLLEQEMRQQVQEAIREHNEVCQHLVHLSAGNMPKDEWSRLPHMMKQGIQHRAQVEESQMLPATQRMIGDARLR